MELRVIHICYMATVVGLTHAYENLALRKSTWQSTTFNSNVGSEKAVDGLKSDLSYHGKQCSISKNGTRTATWRVNLGGIYSIHSIVIYYRTDNAVWNAANGYTSRFLGFSVFVSNTTDKNDGYLCFHDTTYTKSSIPAIANIVCPVHGQYVIYYNERLQGVTYPNGYSPYAFTELCEVEVFGCIVGQFGFNCQYRCSEHCSVTNKCNITTGHCEDGCKPGWKGLLCDKECDEGQYGVNCLEVCGSCRDEYPCHHVNGTCREGCIPGYDGDKCDKICSFGSFGDECKEECSTFCKKTRDCNHKTGSCKDGCKAGWQGHDCFEIQAKEEPDWQSRFYGVLAALCVCVAVIAVLIAVLFMLQRRLKSGRDNGQTTNGSRDQQFNISFEDVKTDEHVKSEYHELSDRKEPSTYDVIR